MNTAPKVIVALITLIAILAGLGYFVASDDSAQENDKLLQKIANLETQVDQLQRQLAEKQNKGTAFSNRTLSKDSSPAENINSTLENGSPIRNYSGSGMQELPLEHQTLDQLRNLASTNPSEASAMLRALVEKNRNNENSRVVARGIYDLSKDPESLPNDLLTSIYSNQTDQDVKRISAQVLAQRGDNSLLEKYIAEGASQITHQDPAERSAALYALSKTGSKLAATAIQPLLHDPDTSVRMDALLALRSTGNQSHLSGVKQLLNDPDENVRDLARDVIDNLSSLSENAHTKVTDADISQGLLGYEDPNIKTKTP
jgi:hypothetical protein